MPFARTDLGFGWMSSTQSDYAAGLPAGNGTDPDTLVRPCAWTYQLVGALIRVIWANSTAGDPVIRTRTVNLKRPGAP